MDPPSDEGINSEAMRNLAAAWPVFEKAVVAQTWGGMMDVTPDFTPGYWSCQKFTGPYRCLRLFGSRLRYGSCGWATSCRSGHAGARPLVDPTPYRLDRF